METNEADDIKKLFPVFKSYYVVWKLKKNMKYTRFKNSLNRTM